MVCTPWLVCAQTTPAVPPDTCPAALFGAEVPASKDAIRSQLLALSPLVDACDPRADFHALRGALLLSAGWPHDAVGDGELRLNAAVQGRHAADTTVADNQLAEGGVAYALPMGPGVVLGSLGLHSFVQAGLYNYKDQAYSLKYGHALGPLQPQPR